jgi:hypothetical protein
MPERPDLPDLQELTKGLTNAARDAAFVVVGLGVMGFQRAQVRRVAVQKLLADDSGLDGALGDVRTEVSRHAGEIDQVVGSVLGYLRTTLEPLEEQLPSPVREATKRVHEQADAVRAMIRDLLVVPSGAQDTSAPDSGAQAQDTSAPDSGAQDSSAPDSGAQDSAAPDSGAQVSSASQ